MPITQADAQRFAAAWLTAWNAHDLEQIFEHYADDFCFSSPVICARGFSGSGVLQGKTALRAYWERGLSSIPPLQFELLELFLGSDCVTIRYRSVGRALVAETFFFGPEGKVVRAAAAYAPLD